MFRLFSEHGWRCPRWQDYFSLIHNVLVKNCHSIHGESIEIKENITTKTTECRTMHQNIITNIRVLRNHGNDFSAESVDVTVSEWDVLVSDFFVVYEDSKRNLPTLISCTEEISDETYVISEKKFRVARNFLVSKRTESDSYIKLTGCDGDSREFDLKCKKYGTVLVYNISMYVSRDVTSVVVLSSKNMVECLPYADAGCVNACYTCSIIGKIHKNARLRAYSQTKGVCGVQCRFSSSLGVMKIYPSRFGVSRVTCKAFQDYDKVETQLKCLCDTLRVRSADDMQMHMMVLHGILGSYIDIERAGFFERFIGSTFQNITYNQKIEELNEHVCVKWNSMYDLFVVLFPEKDIETSTKRCLVNAEMTMTVTRLGTSIYRISNKRRPDSDSRVTYSQNTETTIISTVKALHKSVHLYSISS